MADKLDLGQAIGPLLDKLVYERFLKWITPEKLQEMVETAVRNRVGSVVRTTLDFLLRGLTGNSGANDLDRAVATLFAEAVGPIQPMIQEVLGPAVEALTLEQRAKIRENIREKVRTELDRRLYREFGEMAWKVVKAKLDEEWSETVITGIRASLDEQIQNAKRSR
jgi:hypothetical protein